MIAVTGGSGFLGSALIGYLNSQGIHDILVVDDFEIDRRAGYASRANYTYLQNKKFIDIAPITNDSKNPFDKKNIDFIYHLGAISDTLCQDEKKIKYFNLDNTKCIYEYAKERDIPMVFASSASVMGNGSGPLNRYAQSKFDCESIVGDYACSFRIFNAYGPNEYHKGYMASMIYRWFKQAQSSGKIELFRNSDQFFRDFIYVDDLCRVMYGSFKNYKSGVFDLGTGIQSSFQDVAENVLKHIHGEMHFIDMPEPVRSHYQTNTIADTSSLLEFGWIDNFKDIKSGIKTYMNYLLDGEKTI